MDMYDTLCKFCADNGNCIDCVHRTAEPAFACRKLIKDVTLNLLTQPRWIPCTESMPPERATIFARLKGTDKWRPGMFSSMSEDVRVVVEFEDGSRMVSHDKTIEGQWRSEVNPVGVKKKVTHWIPNPELPEAET